jgi:hypothetical protein
MSGRSFSVRAGNWRAAGAFLLVVPRYFFHLFNDLTACDPEGQELPDDAAAIEQAIINIRALASETVCEGRLNLNHRIEVRTADGETVRTVYFRDAVEVTS